MSSHKDEVITFKAEASLAEAIRRGIKELKQAQREKTYKKLVESTCGLWQKENGLENQRGIRSEWD